MSSAIASSRTVLHSSLLVGSCLLLSLPLGCGLRFVPNHEGAESDAVEESGDDDQADDSEAEESGDDGQKSDDDEGEDEGGDDDGALENDEEAVERCSEAGLEWKTARKTNYTSHPDPNSKECEEFNGCHWAGLFAGCGSKKTEDWVSQHDIAAMFPNYRSLAHHEICIRKGDRVMIVNVIDTCADSDCNGCCTKNQADNDALVDLEYYTNKRWGLADSKIEWADLGPRSDRICN